MSYDSWKTTNPADEYDNSMEENFIEEWSLNNDTWLNNFLCQWVEDERNYDRDEDGYYIKEFDSLDILEFLIGKGLNDEYLDDLYEEDINDYISAISSYLSIK